MPEHLHFLSDHEKANVIYQKWVYKMREKGKSIKKTVMSLTVDGMVKYGFQLTMVELCSILSIYLIRLIIDYLHDQKDYFYGYRVVMFFSFNAARFVAIHIRNYYDCHAYNYYRFV